MTDAGGAVVARYAYDAFGSALWHEGVVSTPYQAAGEPFDAETGYYYLRARYLDPGSARFVTMDSMQGTPEDPFSINGYLYANSDPTSFIDPSGHESMISWTYALYMDMTVGGILFDMAMTTVTTVLAAGVTEAVTSAMESANSVETQSLAGGFIGAGGGLGAMASIGATKGWERLWVPSGQGGTSSWRTTSYTYAGLTFSSGIPISPSLLPYVSGAAGGYYGSAYNVFNTSDYSGFFANATMTAGPAILFSYSIWGTVFSTAHGASVTNPFTMMAMSWSFLTYEVW